MCEWYIADGCPVGMFSKGFVEFPPGTIRTLCCGGDAPEKGIGCDWKRPQLPPDPTYACAGGACVAVWDGTGEYSSFEQCQESCRLGGCSFGIYRVTYTVTRERLSNGEITSDTYTDDYVEGKVVDIRPWPGGAGPASAQYLRENPDGSQAWVPLSGSGTASTLFVICEASLVSVARLDGQPETCVG